jgi:hypothetical protein
MSLILPPAKNYQSPLIAFPSRLLRDPPDGPRQIPMEFDWAAMGMASGSGSTAQTAISVNLSNNAPLRFSQIVSLKVDNSLCGCDVQFVFTDTQETVLVPAYAPNAIFPVFTDQTQFVAIAMGTVLASDVTRVQVLNFVPPPVDLEPSQEQYYTQTTGLSAGAVNADLQLVPATVNGTLEFLQMNFSCQAAPAAAATGFIWVQDGAGNFLVNSIALQGGPASPPSFGQIILDLRELNWRFSQGVKAHYNAALGNMNGTVNVTAGYRTP